MQFHLLLLNNIHLVVIHNHQRKENKRKKKKEKIKEKNVIPQFKDEVGGSSTSSTKRNSTSIKSAEKQSIENADFDFIIADVPIVSVEDILHYSTPTNNPNAKQPPFFDLRAMEYNLEIDDFDLSGKNVNEELEDQFWDYGVLLDLLGSRTKQRSGSDASPSLPPSSSLTPPISPRSSF